MVKLPKRRVRIASRGSRLALWQAETVRELLLASDTDLEVEISIIRTTGDRVTDVPLARIGGRGLFTREVDDALLDGRADIAVHSLKDVPTTLPDGLVLAALTEREDPRDVLIGPAGTVTSLEALPPGARVGTSSLRRRAQLRRIRPDLEVIDLRGNLDTRLNRLDEGAYDAIILAAAGMVRLGWAERISSHLPSDSWLPAVGQGALGIVVREGDTTSFDTVRVLHHPESAAAVTAERSFLGGLEGGCQVPIGALATVKDGELSIDGFVADLEGNAFLRERITGSAENAAVLGETLARRLIRDGANEILDAVRASVGGPEIPSP
ncbi:MAG: hydroxymethylbilane synthase [Gemmatimonadota bacterium]|jgi:hydroxymethylbilane synthase|nr:hydroxymethylbilane synthase [Gemmatimonadota bacterium]